MFTNVSKLVALISVCTSLIIVSLFAHAEYEPGYCAFDFLIAGSKESIAKFRVTYDKDNIFHKNGGRCTEISYRESEFYGNTIVKAEDIFVFRCYRPTGSLIARTSDIYLDVEAKTMSLAATTCATNCKPCKGSDGSYNCVSDYPLCRTLCK